MIQNNWKVLTVLLFLVSCNVDTEWPDSNPDNEREIRFEIALDPQTRVATDAGFTSTWEEGDEIGIFAVKTPVAIIAQLQPANNYLHNLKLTYQNGTWISDTPVYFPNDGEVLDFYAYYPFDAALTNPTAYDFSVATDQRSGYNTSDFLVAKTAQINKTTPRVLLAFEHQWSVEQVEVLREPNMPHLDGDFTVTLTHVQTGAKVNFNKPSGEYDLQGSREDIRMHKVAGAGHVYRAVVPAQTLPANTTVTFKQTTTGKEIDMEYTALAGKVLVAGKAHKYKLTLSWYDIDPDHVYSVGDVYPHAGPEVGIVYEISNGGKNGKVISLDEFQGAWSDHESLPGAEDQNNGLNNMRDIAEYIRTNPDKEWSNFPVFEWVHAKNGANEEYMDKYATGVWYLPSINEWPNFYQVYVDGGRDMFNGWLTQAGGVMVTTLGHWSSTSRSSNSAFHWNMFDGSSGGLSKTLTSYRARCILTF